MFGTLFVYVSLLFGQKRDFSFRIGNVCLYIGCIVFISLYIPVHGVVVQLEGSNLDNAINQAEIVFVNFYADWCRFSQMLTPVFEEASNKFPGDSRVSFASVDCDRHNDVAQKYHINKYPTLKLFRNGQLAKREYRGQRSADALAGFIQSQLEDAVKDFSSSEDLESRLETDEDQVFSGNLQDFEYMRQWITDKCIPLVREITFENAEELTEEGIPFLILFRNPADTAIVETYTQQVASELADQKASVNFLTADGKKFAHPLHHLGKTEKDLPVLAIDSFRHMYLFPNMQELTIPGKLKQFIADLHSGKLHREFHHGPDPTQPPVQQQESHPPGAPAQIPDQGQMEGRPQEQQKTSPPESVFEKLKPSRNRYTILKDEL